MHLPVQWSFDFTDLDFTYFFDFTYFYFLKKDFLFYKKFRFYVKVRFYVLFAGDQKIRKIETPLYHHMCRVQYFFLQLWHSEKETQEKNGWIG